MLGIARDADGKAIKDAFRALALKYHPDRNKQPGAEERFKEIAEAYAVLSDPKKRAEYDRRGFAGVSGFSPEDLFGGIDFGDIFGREGFGVGGLGGLFEHWFRRHRSGPPTGQDIEIELPVPLDKVARGGEEIVRFNRVAVCADCGGSGAARGTQPKPCPSCRGTGRLTESRREHEGNVLIEQISICPACAGRGSIVERPCAACAGTGRTEHGERIAVTIPAGVEEGMALKVAGKGEASEETGGVPGDLYVVVRSVPDARFVRDGADLWRSETLAVADAVLGTTLTVPTLDEPVTVTVPPGTQPDAVLRLRGKGLPHFRGQGWGDLYLRLKVQVPERLTPAERELYDKLRKLASH